MLVPGWFLHVKHIFHITYFDHITSPSPTPLRSSTSPYPSNFMLPLFSLSLKNTPQKKIRTRKQRKISKTKQKKKEKYLLSEPSVVAVGSLTMSCCSSSLWKSQRSDHGPEEKAEKGPGKSWVCTKSLNTISIMIIFFLQIFFCFLSLLLSFQKKKVNSWYDWLYVLLLWAMLH